MIIALVVLSAFALGEEPPEGFTALFNGKNLDGWYGHGTDDPRKLWAMSPEELEAHKEKTRFDIARHWRAEDGVRLLEAQRENGPLPGEAEILWLLPAKCDQPFRPMKF